MFFFHGFIVLSVRLQFINLFLQVDDVERQFLDLLEQEFVHLAHVHTVFLDLGGRWHVGQVAMEFVFLRRTIIT